MSVQAIATILSTLGAGAILLKLCEALIQRFFGRQKREQSAWVQRDREAKARRQLEETLAATRLFAIEQGVPSRDLPPWPSYRLTEE